LPPTAVLRLLAASAVGAAGCAAVLAWPMAGGSRPAVGAPGVPLAAGGCGLVAAVPSRAGAAVLAGSAAAVAVGCAAVLPVPALPAGVAAVAAIVVVALVVASALVAVLRSSSSRLRRPGRARPSAGSLPPRAARRG